MKSKTQSNTKLNMLLAASLFAIVAGLVSVTFLPVHAGELPATSEYKVLDPIRHGSLTVFPVVVAKSHSTSEFLTLDEGLRSGEVVVTEYGSVRGLIRRHTPATQHPLQAQGADVNRLVLVNNSKHPLLLLAGEIVTGGKQDRVIGKDRIVPAESDPVDLAVFCVEPGRWVGSTAQFGASGTMYGEPAVRARAMADKNQEMVWSEVRKAQGSMALQLSAPMASALS